MSTSGTRAGARFRPRQGRSSSKCSRGPRDVHRSVEVGSAEALAAPFGERVRQGVFFAKAGRRPIRPRYAASRRALRPWNSLDLGPATCPVPGSPTICANWPSPSIARDQRRASSASSSSRPTSGVRARAPPRRAAAARAHDAVERDPGAEGSPLSSCSPLSSTTNSPAVWRWTRGCDEDRARVSGALDPRGDIRRVAEGLARRVNYDLPGIKADPRGKLRRAFSAVPGVDFDKRAGSQAQRAWRAQRRSPARGDSQRHQPVAELLRHMPAQPRLPQPTSRRDRR